MASSSESEEGFMVVEKPYTFKSGLSLVFSSLSEAYDECKRVGLGSLSKRLAGPREVDPRRSSGSIKLEEVYAVWLMAVAKSISYFQDQVRRHHVLVLSDNLTTVIYICGKTSGHQMPILNQNFESDLLVDRK